MQHNDIHDLEVKLNQAREKTVGLLLDSKDLVEAFSKASITQAKNEFRIFFESLLKDVEFTEVEDGLTASWYDRLVSLKLLHGENRFIDLLPAFDITFGAKSKRISAFDLDRLPLFNNSIFYRINNQEHMLRCQIDKQMAIHTWLILIKDKSSLRVGFGQVLRFNPTDYCNVYPKLSDLLASWYGVS